MAYFETCPHRGSDDISDHRRRGVTRCESCGFESAAGAALPAAAQAVSDMANYGYGNIGVNNVGFFNNGELNLGINNQGFGNLGIANISPNPNNLMAGNIGLFNNGLANIGIGNTAPANAFTVGSTSTLEVDVNGNLVHIRGVAYSWPSSQGGATTYLKNDGSGGLAGASSGGCRWGFSRFCNFNLGLNPFFLALSRFSNLFLANPHSVLPGNWIE